MTAHDHSIARERQKRLVFDMMAEGALRVVTHALTEAEIPFAPVKGVVLSRWIYDDVRDRPYVDIDLLVSRAHFIRVLEIVDRNRWRVFYRSHEMGEVSFVVDRVTVEIHAEFGRLDLSHITVSEVLARSRPDKATFSFPVLRIDDIDHFLLLVTNVVKDSFTYANSHQPADLDRQLERLRPRWQEMVDRAIEHSLSTALAVTISWMVEEHRSQIFMDFRQAFPLRSRRLFCQTFRLHRITSVRRSERLKDPGSLFGLGLATLTPDDLVLRVRGLGRVIRRGVSRRFNRDPG